MTKLDELLKKIKKVYNVDLNKLRDEETRADDKALNRKRKYKNSFYISNKEYKKLYDCDRVLNLPVCRVIEKFFTTESNGGYGVILTPKE